MDKTQIIHELENIIARSNKRGTHLTTVRNLVSTLKMETDILNNIDPPINTLLKAALDASTPTWSFVIPKSKFPDIY